MIIAYLNGDKLQLSRILLLHQNILSSNARVQFLDSSIGERRGVLDDGLTGEDLSWKELKFCAKLWKSVFHRNQEFEAGILIFGTSTFQKFWNVGIPKNGKTFSVSTFLEILSEVLNNNFFLNLRVVYWARKYQKKKWIFLRIFLKCFFYWNNSRNFKAQKWTIDFVPANLTVSKTCLKICKYHC